MRLIDAEPIEQELFKKADKSLAKNPYENARICAFRQAFELILGAPTITPPPNDPLTLEELRERDEPVWVECDVTPCTPDGGYYCLCQNGNITTPSGMQYIAEDIPHWKFYRRKPEEDHS